MKQDLIFRREEAFKAWLPDNNVKASVNYYISDIKAIQNYFNEDIDKFLKRGLDLALQRINRDNIPRSEHMIRNYRSVLKKYWLFTQDK